MQEGGVMPSLSPLHYPTRHVSLQYADQDGDAYQPYLVRVDRAHHEVADLDAALEAL